MVSQEWTYRDRIARDGRSVAPVGPARDPERGFAAAVSMAYREVPAELPDDMMRLLAKLN